MVKSEDGNEGVSARLRVDRDRIDPCKICMMLIAVMLGFEHILL